MPSVADFAIERLENTGIKHVFGLPGDYILDFFSKLVQSKKIELITNADEAGAGFAADGYARANGLGCVCVTYAVGALKLFNSIAGAFAERSPVIVISGAPGISERGNPPLHHTIGNVEIQRAMFKQITCAQAILDDPTTAGYEIDRAFEMLKHHKQPIYIELPRDVSMMPLLYDVYVQGTPKAPNTDMDNLEDALKEVAGLIEDAKNPVILAGVELARCKLGKEVVRFAEKHNIAMASTLLSKSVINEMHPLYIGVYAGSNSSKSYVKDMVENSDCLLVCGEVLTEATVGYRPSKVFQKREMITCTIQELKVRNHNYPNIVFTDFCKALFKTELTQKQKPAIPEKPECEAYKCVSGNKLTIMRIFEKINSVLDEDTVVVADVGDSLLGASDLTMHHAGTFYGPAFYLSMGFAIPATLGIKLAKPNVRPIVLVGDGAFQMSMSELSSINKYNKQNPPLVIVVNNRGYTTERMIVDGKFNDIPEWNYHKVCDLIGGGKGFKVTNEDEFEAGVSEWVSGNSLVVLNCILDPLDTSPALKRMTASLSKKVKRENNNFHG
jgi:indolepyruvate decarboxylase